MRCAIYTRKSSAEGLDGEFTSLDNQRQYCAAYIASQAGNGWRELPTRYDDGGYSGANMKRPALSQLRRDIEDGLVDVVIVYKIDRLSRSLRDFSNLVSEFEDRGVTFVSVTQSFNTSTSMGRLTLNVLLSFAQFERELTAERLREWFAAARSKGYWTNHRPYGYQVLDKRHLVLDPAEASVVRRIFRRYATLGSAGQVATELFTDGIMQKNGRPWSSSMVMHTIKNRLYRGDLIHRSRWLPGIHEPIISPALWAKAQKTYLSCKQRTLSRPQVAVPLKGLLFDRLGKKMNHTFLHAKGRLYRYYVAGAERRKYGADSDAYMRFRAPALERAVIDIVIRMTGHADRSRTNSEVVEMLRRHILRIDLDHTQMIVTFRTGATVIDTPGGRLGPRTRQRPGQKWSATRRTA